MNTGAVGSAALNTDVIWGCQTYKKSAIHVKKIADRWNYCTAFWVKPENVLRCVHWIKKLLSRFKLKGLEGWDCRGVDVYGLMPTMELRLSPLWYGILVASELATACHHPGYFDPCFRRLSETRWKRAHVVRQHRCLCFGLDYRSRRNKIFTFLSWWHLVLISKRPAVTWTDCPRRMGARSIWIGWEIDSTGRSWGTSTTNWR